MGPEVYFIYMYSAAIPGVYLNPGVYMNPALTQTNTVAIQL